ncbi:MAG: redoxin domain-containing protein, partial [Muribaculaceae bacterium]|nr:redoxin domain-containing protein [Muribaculaceae bacterium]
NIDEEAGEFLLHNRENENLSIKIGKEKDGKQSFKIGSEKPRILSRISGPTLPAYPSKNYRTNIIDTYYQHEDSVTISGWMRGLTHDMIQQMGNKVSIGYAPLEGYKIVSTEMDSIGRFSITLPAINSLGIYIGSLFIPVEPRKNYYLLWDKGNRIIMMGDDTRIQNEIISFNIALDPPMKELENENYIERMDRWRTALNDSIDSLRLTVPTLSDLALNFIHNKELSRGASRLGQSRFFSPTKMLTDSESDYARDNFWDEMPKPITLYPSFFTFIKDFVDCEFEKSDYSVIAKHGKGYLIICIPKELVFELKSDTKFINDSKIDFALEIPDSISVVLERIVSRISDFVKINGVPSEDELLYTELKCHWDFLKDIDTSSEIMDVYIKDLYINHMEHDVTPLSNFVRNSIDTLISSPYIRDLILRENDKYEKMKEESKAFDLYLNKGGDISMSSNGKDLFEKFIEPFRGKFVLIDIWGTWCAPCQEAMKDFVKEYETLSPYGVEFLFFANNSNDEVIRTVVFENNVTGECVLHYNLPEKQQKALEEYLNVNGYPSYILIDPEGNIVNEHVDARDLENLAQLIKRIRNI